MKVLRGIVFVAPEDDEYDGMAHVWVRDVETSYWFSLSRAVDSEKIEVMVSDQLTYSTDALAVTLTSFGIRPS